MAAEEPVEVHIDFVSGQQRHFVLGDYSKYPLPIFLPQRILLQFHHQLVLQAPQSGSLGEEVILL